MALIVRADEGTRETLRYGSRNIKLHGETTVAVKVFAAISSRKTRWAKLEIRNFRRVFPNRFSLRRQRLDDILSIASWYIMPEAGGRSLVRDKDTAASYQSFSFNADQEFSSKRRDGKIAVKRWSKLLHDQLDVDDIELEVEIQFTTPLPNKQYTMT